MVARLELPELCRSVIDPALLGLGLKNVLADNGRATFLMCSCISLTCLMVDLKGNGCSFHISFATSSKLQGLVVSSSSNSMKPVKVCGISHTINRM